MNNKKFTSIALAVVVTLTSVFSGTTTVKASEDFGKANPCFEIVGETSEYGLIPMKINLPEKTADTKAIANQLGTVTGATPSAYMNTRAAVNAKFPATRNQSPYGTCWAHAAMALAEFNLVTKGKANKTVDLSELHLAYFTYHTATDPLGGTAGDTTFFASTEGYLDMGGNPQIAERTLFNWKGVVNEATLPYSTVATNPNASVNSGLAYTNRVATIKDFTIIPCDTTQYGLENAKAAIMKYGAVMIGYRAGYSVYNPIEWAGEACTTFYNSKKGNSNHAVTIVGWDDNIPASYFSDYGNIPEGNGGWLIRNSWTTDSNDSRGNGYFWLSYYDKTIVKEVYAMDFEAGNPYERNYQYDGGYAVASNYGTGYYFNAAGNIYKAKTNESIKAVAISNWHYYSDTYTIEVYSGCKNGNPVSGTKIHSQKSTVTLGQHTIALNKAVGVAKGTNFSVVIKSASKCYDYELDYKTSDSFYTDATPSGKSYTLYGGKWYSAFFTDAGDLSLKVFTTTAHPIKLGKMKAPSASSKKAKTLTIKWKKLSKAAGYEVQVATDKKFKKGVKKATVKKGSTTSATIKSLKKGTAYYVRVRAYAKKDGVKTYSAWATSKKTVKTK